MLAPKIVEVAAISAISLRITAAASLVIENSLAMFVISLSVPNKAYCIISAIAATALAATITLRNCLATCINPLPILTIGSNGLGAASLISFCLSIIALPPPVEVLPPVASTKSNLIMFSLERPVPCFNTSSSVINFSPAAARFSFSASTNLLRFRCRFSCSANAIFLALYDSLASLNPSVKC